MKADHFYSRPPGHVAGRVGCSVCGRRSGEHPSRLEADFDAQTQRAGLQDGMVPEHPFAEQVGRAWRFDRAWPAIRLAVELDGGRFMGAGGHTTQQDRDRDNAAQLLGWLVLRFDQRQLRLGTAVRQLTAAILLRTAPGAAREGLRAGLSPDLFPGPSAVRALLQELRGRRRPKAVEHRGRDAAQPAPAAPPPPRPADKLPPG